MDELQMRSPRCDRRDNRVPDEVVSKSPPYVVGAIVPGCEHNNEIKLRENNQKLAAVSIRFVFAVGVFAGFELNSMPRISVRGGCDAVGRSGFSSGRCVDPLLRHDALPIPRAAIQVKLADLQKISWTHE